MKKESFLIRADENLNNQILKIKEKNLLVSKTETLRFLISFYNMMVEKNVK